MNCKKAKEIKLSAVLEKIGAAEKKKTDREIWYLSPFREEKKASFKVDLKRNTWYDFGTGKGGNILDFVMLYFKTDLRGALKKLDKNSFSFPQQKKLKSDPVKRYEIVSFAKLNHPLLFNYLRQRKIDILIARKYCKELRYVVYNSGSKYGKTVKSQNIKQLKPYFTIAFKNDKGGYETRNKHFQNCLVAKAITIINNGSSTLNLFEGFIDFLSYLTLVPKKENEDFIIINSTSIVRDAIEFLPNYCTIKTFFDNDHSGKQATALIEKYCTKDFRNESLKFQKYNDVNDYLMAYSK
ncbi:toprim domain-containing protein [uncultured Christiangramia sp.]|uniref:toprim domain-containing protein n=1 Tax=uncultured Christiangramia sp. TaxID=503836 RepID=UPI00261530FF|nr:toprim domain-containing protein [uncultured Christiangramia sp.]